MIVPGTNSGGGMRGVVCALALGLALGGCASITRGTSDQVNFDSTPTGAEVRTYIVTECDKPCYPGAPAGEGTIVEPRNIPKTGPACTTPCTAQVKKNERIVAFFSKPGFERETVLFYGKPAANGVAGVMGNAIAGGVTGIVIDTVTGAGLDICPNPVAVKLKPFRRGAKPDETVPPARDISAACNVPPASGAGAASPEAPSH